jgi:serpin B
MKKLLVLLSMVILLIPVTACSQLVTGDVLQSDKPWVASPNVDKADFTTLANGNTAFALDLYRVLKKTDGNIFYSPYSISLALAMTYAGARG